MRWVLVLVVLAGGFFWAGCEFDNDLPFTPKYQATLLLTENSVGKSHLHLLDKNRALFRNFHERLTLQTPTRFGVWGTDTWIADRANNQLVTVNLNTLTPVRRLTLPFEPGLVIVGAEDVLVTEHQGNKIWVGYRRSDPKAKMIILPATNIQQALYQNKRFYLASDSALLVFEEESFAVRKTLPLNNSKRLLSMELDLNYNINLLYQNHSGNTLSVVLDPNSLELSVPAPTSFLKVAYSPFTRPIYGQERLTNVTLTAEANLLPENWSGVKDFAVDFKSSTLLWIDAGDSLWASNTSRQLLSPKFHEKILQSFFYHAPSR